MCQTGWLAGSIPAGVMLGPPQTRTPGDALILLG
jgi:hypothetical protein